MSSSGMICVGLLLLLAASCDALCANQWTWTDLERRLPTSVTNIGPEAPFNAEQAKGRVVLFRDSNAWCPFSERIWLALEVKNADYITCLVDDDYRQPPLAKGSLPRIKWRDGTTMDGSDPVAMLERIEQEWPHEPLFFPKVSVSVDVVRDSFQRWEGILPRFTLPSATAPYIFACKLQKAGSFAVEECEIGTLVPKYKYEVCLEEMCVSCQSRPRDLAHSRAVLPAEIGIAFTALLLTVSLIPHSDEVLGEYETGPFIAGADVSAADIYWAPFLERLCAHIPLVHGSRLKARGGRYDALTEWYEAMETLVPAYSCRVKGRMATWQRVLVEEHPEIEIASEVETSLPVEADLPSARDGFDAARVWASYAEARPHVARSPAEEAAAQIVRRRATLVPAVADACGFSSDASDAALAEVCAALLAIAERTNEEGGADKIDSAASEAESGRAELSEEACSAVKFLNAGGFAVPRDLGVIPAEALRALL